MTREERERAREEAEKNLSPADRAILAAIDSNFDLLNCKPYDEQDIIDNRFM